MGDAVYVMPFNTAAHFVGRSLPAIEEGLARGGRGSFVAPVTGEVIVCCGRSEEEMEVGPGRWPVARCLLRLDTRRTARCSSPKVGNRSNPSSMRSPSRDDGTRCRA